MEFIIILLRGRKKKCFFTDRSFSFNRVGGNKDIFKVGPSVLRVRGNKDIFKVGPSVLYT